MADEHQTGNRQSTDETKERLLRDQQLVNEREDRPEHFGGLPENPVETADDATPQDKKRTTPVDEIQANRERRDIQSDGS